MSHNDDPLPLRNLTEREFCGGARERLALCGAGNPNVTREDLDLILSDDYTPEIARSQMPLIQTVQAQVNKISEVLSKLRTSGVIKVLSASTSQETSIQILYDDFLKIFANKQVHKKTLASKDIYFSSEIDGVKVDAIVLATPEQQRQEQEELVTI